MSVALAEYASEGAIHERRKPFNHLIIKATIIGSKKFDCKPDLYWCHLWSNSGPNFLRGKTNFSETLSAGHGSELWLAASRFVHLHLVGCKCQTLYRSACFALNNALDLRNSFWAQFTTEYFKKRLKRRVLPILLHVPLHTV